MNHVKAYATALLVGALMIPATPAFAEKVWPSDHYGFDCERETMVEVREEHFYHYPALPYEIEEQCGVAATIVWSADEQDGDPVFIEPRFPESAPVVSTPAAPVEPAPVVEAPVEEVPLPAFAESSYSANITGYVRMVERDLLSS